MVVFLLTAELFKFINEITVNKFFDYFPWLFDYTVGKPDYGTGRLISPRIAIVVIVVVVMDYFICHLISILRYSRYD